nr:ATP-binding protein [Rhodoplanes serenus]
MSWHLLSYGLGLVVPALLFVSFLVIQFYGSERTRLEERLRSEAHSLAVAIDRDTISVITTLEALAVTPSLRGGDLATFYRHAQEVRQAQNYHLSVRDRNGDAILATRIPLGNRLEGTPEQVQETDRKARESGKPEVSDVFQGVVTQRENIQLVVPVTIDGRREFVLGASMEPDYFRDVLTRTPLPEGWLAAIVDRRGVFVARLRNHADFVGKPASRQFIDNARQGAGLYEGATSEGVLSLVAYDTSRTTGWRVAVSAPKAIIDEALRQSLAVVVMLGLMLGVLALILAHLTRQRIVAAVEQLRRGAHSLAEREVPTLLSTPVREVDEISRALVGAGLELRSRERQRDLAEAALKDLNAELERRVEAAVTDRNKAEAQLRQFQKMEAIGRLTGGIAHDFNNLLTVVLGNLGLLRNRLATLDDPRLMRNIDNAVDGAQRAAQLTSRLLAFSRQSALLPSVVSANTLIEGMTDLLTRTLGEGITIEAELAGDLWRIEVDPNLLENAVLNLAVNARDAMPGGGRLCLRTENLSLGEEQAAAFDPNLKAGDYVRVSVSDTGEGITPDVKARVFEPFFTTKPVGVGTGLGLAQVYGFVKQSGGHVTLDSTVGSGTTVCMYFPRDDRLEQPIRTEVRRERVVHEASGALILVVEDDAMVRQFSTTALEEAGYRVAVATDGLSALQLLREHGPKVALLFTDIVLPGPLNGRALADEAAQFNPTVKVLFTTGYTRDEVLVQRRLDRSAAVLGKPFDAEQLVERIGEMLGD